MGPSKQHFVLRFALTVTATLLGLSFSVDASGTSIVGENVNGGFANLGSLCFPAATKSQVSIKYSVPLSSKGQLLLFYDDQEESYDKLSTTNGDCFVQEQLSRQICAGSSCTAGYTLRTGSQQSYTIDINESRPRQWYFLVSNCKKNPDGTYSQRPVVISDYQISSDAAVDCASIHVDATGGLTVAVVFLTLISGSLLFVVYYLYQKTQKLSPALLSADKTSYNDL